MQRRTYTTLEAAIEGGKEIAAAKESEARENSDLAAMLAAMLTSSCSLFRSGDEYIILQGWQGEIDAKTYAATGEWLGVIHSDLFASSEEIRAEQRRVAEIESRGQ
jgi:hypothetical protein